MTHNLQKIRQRKEKFKMSKLRQNRFRNYSIGSGILLGALIGFIYRVIYWTEAFNLSSIFEQFRWLGSDIMKWAFFGCLIGGLLGYVVSLVVIKYRVRFSS